MIETRLWRGDAHRLEHVGDADCRDIRRQDWLTPRGGEEEAKRDDEDFAARLQISFGFTSSVIRIRLKTSPRSPSCRWTLSAIPSQRSR